tara:strand:+ start:82 stop:231 length:150 start_codon:yes stop_codon:yes gene_type:complete
MAIALVRAIADRSVIAIVILFLFRSVSSASASSIFIVARRRCHVMIALP